jgi:hypothetical protein
MIAISRDPLWREIHRAAFGIDHLVITASLREHACRQEEHTPAQSAISHLPELVVSAAPPVKRSSMVLRMSSARPLLPIGPAQTWMVVMLLPTR